MEEKYLKEMVQTNVGMSISRIKEKENQEGIEQKIITPRAIQQNEIKDAELEIIKIENDDHKLRKTKKGDIIVKTTSPFDVVLIDEQHEGLFYNSFCIDMTVSSEELESTYLFAFLSSKWIRNKLENKVRSYRTTPISKKDIEEIKIPILKKEQQKLIGKLYLNVMEKEKIWKRMIENEKDTIETIIFKKRGFFE